MEDVDSISVAVSNIDINKVEALESRRVVAFINHFLCTTTTFLNQFATQCESKLDRIQQQLFKIESGLRILECKLDSIPDLHLVPPNSTEETSSASIKSTEEIIAKSTVSDPEVGKVSEKTCENADDEVDTGKDEPHSGSEESSPETSKKLNTASLKDDPRYNKYFKMMFVGVPVPAIKQKMMSEGVDPTILDS